MTCHRTCCRPSNVLRVEFARPSTSRASLPWWRRLTPAGWFWLPYMAVATAAIVTFISWGYVDAAMRAAGMRP